MHRALRPGGLLLDIHPEPEHAWIEVHLRGQAHRIGQIDQSIQIQDITLARAALQAVIDAHQFACERVMTIEFLYHFDSVDTWLGHLAERRSPDRIGEDLIARARELLCQGDGEIRMLRSTHAARLRRS